MYLRHIFCWFTTCSSDQKFNLESTNLESTNFMRFADFIFKQLKTIKINKNCQYKLYFFNISQIFSRKFQELKVQKLGIQDIVYLNIKVKNAHNVRTKLENSDHSGRTNERKVLKRQTARRNTGLALRQNSNCPLMKYVHWFTPI